MIMWFLSFILLMCITFIDLYMSNHPCISRKNLALSLPFYEKQFLTFKTVIDLKKLNMFLSVLYQPMAIRADWHDVTYIFGYKTAHIFIKTWYFSLSLFLKGFVLVHWSPTSLLLMKCGEREIELHKENCVHSKHRKEALAKLWPKCHKNIRWYSLECLFILWF